MDKIEFCFCFIIFDQVQIKAFACIKAEYSASRTNKAMLTDIVSVAKSSAVSGKLSQESLAMISTTTVVDSSTSLIFRVVRTVPSGSMANRSDPAVYKTKWVGQQAEGPKSQKLKLLCNMAADFNCCYEVLT